MMIDSLQLIKLHTPASIDSYSPAAFIQYACPHPPAAHLQKFQIDFLGRSSLVPPSAPSDTSFSMTETSDICGTNPISRNLSTINQYTLHRKRERVDGWVGGEGEP